MSLCKLCEGIPFDNLPSIPDDVWNAIFDEKYIHPFFGFSKASPNSTLGYQHHTNLKNLRASAEKCDLCNLISAQADLFIAEHQALEKAEDPGAASEGLPSFEIWLTGRQNGDGFWVFTSAEDRERDVVFLLAAVGFCATEDSPLAQHLPGRPIDGHTKLETMLSRILAWVKLCDEKHPNCGAEETKPMPDFILDVVAEEDGTGVDSIRLCASKDNTKEKYIALSHCWGEGTSPPLTTTKSTLEERKRKINFEDLSASFKDAVSVTRSLGLRYLWIDSLCIIQDDAEDWERQSGNMASVYSYSYLTIAATRAKDSSGGFLNRRAPRQHISLDIKKEGLQGNALAFIPPLKNEAVPDSYLKMNEEPLSNRAWCFQERVLSNRILHFATDQMYFECIDGFRSEDGLRFAGRYDSVHNDASPFSLKGSFENGSLPLLQQWFKLLWGYGPRTLTKPTDKLPALSGIARIFGERMNDEYVAGIWKESFIESLLWQGLSTDEVADARAPSWSWAHYKGICAAGIQEKWKAIGSISSYRIELESEENPYGAVKEGGSVELLAPLVLLSLIERGPHESHSPYIDFCTPNGDDEGVGGEFDKISRKYSDSAELVRNMEIFALILAVDEPASDNSMYHCLLVSPVAGKVDTFRRLGFTFGSEKSFGIKETEFVSQRVVLV